MNIKLQKTPYQYWKPCCLWQNSLKYSNITHGVNEIRFNGICKITVHFEIHGFNSSKHIGYVVMVIQNYSFCQSNIGKLFMHNWSSVSSVCCIRVF